MICEMAPCLIVGMAFDNAVWAILLALAATGFLLVMATLPVKRKVSPSEYADELERHLCGKDADHEWDTTTSVRLKDSRLERLRRSLPDSFDELRTEEDRMSLRRVIDALRNGEFPDLRREGWKKVLQTELTRWSSMSCDAVLAELRGRDVYEVVAESRHYQVEAVLLEDTPEYLHLSIAVDDGSLPASLHPESDSFICRKGQTP